MDSVHTRKTWARQAGYAAASVGAIGAFLAIGRTIHQSRGNSFDKAVMGAMGRARSSALTAAVKTVTFFGSVPGAVAVSLAASYASRKSPRRVAQIGFGALGGIAAELGIKRLFRRVRPDMLQHLERVRSTSFPSGHSMASSSLYLTLALVGTRSEWIRPYRVPIIIGAGAFAAAIGATRVYLGVHWPTDVLGGLALGTAWACATEALFDWARAEELSSAPATT